MGRWGAYPDVDLELDSFTLTQAQTQTLRTVRALRTLRTVRALRALRTLPSASVADPNKSTFTVTLKTPDGDIVFECPPDQYVLDEAEEQEIEGADGLPYACRAGSCSACAGKLVSGTMDTSACGFLSEEQKAAGWVLTCTAKPTSDCVIETHKEDDMY